MNLMFFHSVFQIRIVFESTPSAVHFIQQNHHKTNGSTRQIVYSFCPDIINVINNWFQRRRILCYRDGFAGLW